MAEAVLLDKVRRRGLEGKIAVESAGTGDWHVGECPDPRTVAELAKHGIPPVSRARQVRSSDFTEFDYVIGMDEANRRDLLRWRGSDPDRVSLLLEWDASATRSEVPDPYYGGPEGFAEMFRMIDSATDALLAQIGEE
jgi:protein-tyrosine phosphatase